MKAVVMAGGLGSRLHPLTAKRPKPMVPLVNKPVLFHILNLLKHHNITEVVITVRHMAHHVQEHFGDGSQLGLNIRYAIEEAPLGTAGGVKNAERYLDKEPFLVISSDIVTDIDLSNLLQYHREKQAAVTMALKRVSNPKGYGVVVLDTKGGIRQLLEKPEPSQITSNIVNTGIYILEPDVLNYMQADTKYDFSYDIFPALLEDEAPVFGYLANRYWRDIGTIQSYEQAVVDVLNGKVSHINLGNKLSSNVWVGRDVSIASDVCLFGPIYLGDNVKIKKGATLYGPTVIHEGSIIDRKAWIRHSIIDQESYIGKETTVYQSIVSQKSHVESDAVVIRKLVHDETPVGTANSLLHSPYTSLKERLMTGYSYSF
ncbi:MAG: NDP-sugar synthase [Anaerolineaceae bacterium]|nr:NDP-sugar synthase [Anaerolineaceae bacterium]MCB9099239.1 NDP-sugar synthase [Anaerolineales bacterium]